MDQDLLNELKSKQILHWNARNFVTLPYELCEFGSNVEEMYLRWNNIHCLPPWMGISLSNLTNLYMEFNKLSDLPKELSRMANLQVLQLDSNNFTTIPSVVFSLQKLICLKMSSNLIGIIPSDIGVLTNLQHLDLSNNLLNVLPAEIMLCDGLKELILNDNKLLYLPRSATQMPNLEHINVASNMLHFLPAIPFCSRPTIDISFNCKLNWCSAQALGQNFTNLDTTEQINEQHKSCNSWTLIQCVNGQQCIETVCSSVTQTIFLPLGLRIYNMNESKIPSLLELAQRFLYKQRGLPKPKIHSDDAMDIDCCESDFPNNTFYKTLFQSPAAICYVCQNAIFHHAYCTLTHSQMLQIPHSVILFCCRMCAIYYFKFS